MAIYLAPFIRMIGDLIGLSFGENSTANRAIIVSGGLFIIAAAVVAGLFGSQALYSLTPAILYGITVPIIVQVVTSYVKLTDSNEFKLSDPRDGVSTKEGSTKSSDRTMEENYTPPRQ
jgi:hypothetical protein